MNLLFSHKTKSLPKVEITENEGSEGSPFLIKGISRLPPWSENKIELSRNRTYIQNLEGFCPLH
jgi:hypothetical protein